MPLWKFRSMGEAERHLDHRPMSPEASLGTALFLLTLSEASRRGVRTALRGLRGYATIEEAEVDRARFALQRLKQSTAQADDAG